MHGQHPKPFTKENTDSVVELLPPIFARANQLAARIEARNNEINGLLELKHRRPDIPDDILWELFFHLVRKPYTPHTARRTIGTRGGRKNRGTRRKTRRN